MRNTINGLLFMSISFCFSQTCLAASLQLPNNAETVLVNGKTSQQSNIKLDLSTADAMQQIAFRYQARYRSNGSQNHFTSDVIILRFSASDQHYQLLLPNIRTQSSAEQFNNSPKLTLTDQAGNPVKFTQDKLMKNGLQIGRDFEQEIAKYNAAANPASWRSTTKVTATVAAPVTSVVTATPVTSAITVAPVVLAITDVRSEGTRPVITDNTEQPNQAEVSNMLDYWYQKANPQTQAEFKARINQ